MAIVFFQLCRNNNFEEKIHHTCGGLIAHDSGQALKKFGWLKRMLIVVSRCVETLSGIVKGRAEEDLLTRLIITDPPLLGTSPS